MIKTSKTLARPCNRMARFKGWINGTKPNNSINTFVFKKLCSNYKTISNFDYSPLLSTNLNWVKSSSSNQIVVKNIRDEVNQTLKWETYATYPMANQIQLFGDFGFAFFSRRFTLGLYSASDASSANWQYAKIKI